MKCNNEIIVVKFKYKQDEISSTVFRMFLYNSRETYHF